ncbi:hypothetical protein Tco_0854779 [Tanacetum coccineum]
MVKSSNGDTPFSLTYKTEAVIPAEIGMLIPFELEWDPLPNYTIGSSNSFEWYKIIFGMITSMGIRHAKAYTLRGRSSKKLGQSEDYDKEREMEPRPEPNWEATPTLRPRSPVVRRQRERVVGFEEAPNREGSRRGKNAEVFCKREKICGDLWHVPQNRFSPKTEMNDTVIEAVFDGRGLSVSSTKFPLCTLNVYVAFDLLRDALSAIFGLSELKAWDARDALGYILDCTLKDLVAMSADSAVTYTSVHSEARSWSIPSEDPYEEAARQLLEPAPHSPEYQCTFQSLSILRT